MGLRVWSVRWARYIDRQAARLGWLAPRGGAERGGRRKVKRKVRGSHATAEGTNRQTELMVLVKRSKLPIVKPLLILGLKKKILKISPLFFWDFNFVFLFIFC